jgi:hypothetical protein
MESARIRSYKGALFTCAMPAASSGATSPLSGAATASVMADTAGTVQARSGVFACRAATVASGVNPPEQRPSVRVATADGVAHSRAARR